MHSNFYKSKGKSLPEIRRETESEREREERGDGAKGVRFKWQTVQERRRNVERTNWRRRRAPQEDSVVPRRRFILGKKGVEASVDGVLGGFGKVNDVDIKGSEAFLQTLFFERFNNAARTQHLVALDCGSGIGRITKNLLIRHFNEVKPQVVSFMFDLTSVHGEVILSEEIISLSDFKAFVHPVMMHFDCMVDLLEPVSHFLDAARESLASENHVASDTHKAANFFCVPLQEFTPDAGKYDVIWIQWCIGHLTDDDFVSFFKRAKDGLKPGGFFVLKENIARSGFVLDNEDRSITRSDLYFKELFSRCGLHIYKSKDQKGLPEELFAVKMYALTADMPKKVHKTRSKTRANRPGIIQ
ncbi:hypothetical protein Pint_11368 [Pistacia integerrima]|uniref:Uncharacterized protein n=1 Tax=Pistacia integerrima TaxID=434235 RepID=A0ACC0XMT3_9ROSI|nr:hypothetical protein Pint_11368 [Pistacia integerrima]